jgi:hypothetical protein
VNGARGSACGQLAQLYRRNVRSGSIPAVVRRRSSILRPSHRTCVVSQRLCVRRLLPSQIICAENGVLLRVGPYIIVRRQVSLIPTWLGYKVHPLTGKRKRQWAAWVTGNCRLTFEFEADHATNVDLEDYH